MAPRKMEKKNDNELLHEKENENKLKKSVEIVATFLTLILGAKIVTSPFSQFLALKLLKDF